MTRTGTDTAYITVKGITTSNVSCTWLGVNNGYSMGVDINNSDGTSWKSNRLSFTPQGCGQAVMDNWNTLFANKKLEARLYPGPSTLPQFAFHMSFNACCYLTSHDRPTGGEDPTPASCTAQTYRDIDFGTIDPKEINGKKATSSVVVSCDKKASVRVRFMTREGLAIFQMDNGLTTYLKIDDNPGTAGSYQTVAENASSPARAFNLSAELLGTSGSVKPGAFSYTAVVRVDIL
ncbi:hypothetical protein ABUV01_004824 [Serratia marcescens]